MFLISEAAKAADLGSLDVMVCGMEPVLNVTGWLLLAYETWRCEPLLSATPGTGEGRVGGEVAPLVAVRQKMPGQRMFERRCMSKQHAFPRNAVPNFGREHSKSPG